MNNWLTVAKEYMRVMLSGSKQIGGFDNARPTYDVMLQLYYESVLQPGDVAIDVGAHMGGHTFPIAKSVFPSGRVYAFEPLSTCRETLQERMKSDYAEYQEIIDIYPCALSDYQGPSEFVVVIDDPAYSGLRKRTYDTTSNLRRISVTVQTIDALFQQLPSLEFIKIDAEGAEFDIMKGAHKVLKKFRPFIAFEFGANSIKEYETTPKSTYGYIKKLDYMLFDILGNEITDSAQFQKSANDQHVWDYIALPEEDRMLKQKTRKTLRSLQDGTIEVA